MDSSKQVRHLYNYIPGHADKILLNLVTDAKGVATIVATSKDHILAFKAGSDKHSWLTSDEFVGIAVSNSNAGIV